MTNKRSFIDRAIGVLQRYRAKTIRRRDAAKVEGLPDYLLKDIGWPSATVDLRKDCTQC